MSIIPGWKSFTLEVLEGSAVQNLQYLAPGHHCVLDHPVKVKRHGKYGKIYCQVANHSGHFYSLNASIMDSFDRTKLSEATFLVPHREPSLSVHQYHAEWNADLAAYVILPAELNDLFGKLSDSTFATLVNSVPEKKHNRQTTNQTRSGVDVDTLFDIEHLPRKADKYWEDKRQYDLGLFAVRDFGTPATSTPSTLAVTTPPADHEEIDIQELLKPQVFDWSEEFEAVECPATTEPPMSSSVKQADTRELLKPQVFDWSEESEVMENPPVVMEVPMPNLVKRVDTGELLKPQVFNWSEESEVTENAPVDIELPMFNPAKPFDTSDEQREKDSRCDLSSPFIIDSSRYYEPQSPSTSDCTTLDYPSPLAIYEPVVQLSDEAEPSSLGCEDQAFEAQDGYVTTEALWQESLMRMYPNIHHFNWLGNPVMERSYTPPEVSLFVIASPPKASLSALVSRESCVLRQAMQFVDPIVYQGEPGDLEYSGHTLIKATTGRTFQFYTGAGTWLSDRYDWDDNKPILDQARSSRDYCGPWIPISGRFENAFSWTPQAYMQESQWRLDDLQKDKMYKRSGANQYRRTPLREWTTANSNGDVTSTEHVGLRRARGSTQYFVLGDCFHRIEHPFDDASSSSSKEDSQSTAATTPPDSGSVTTLDEDIPCESSYPRNSWQCFEQGKTSSSYRHSDTVQTWLLETDVGESPPSPVSGAQIGDVAGQLLLDDTPADGGNDSGSSFLAAKTARLTTEPTLPPITQLGGMKATKSKETIPQFRTQRPRSKVTRPSRFWLRFSPRQSAGPIGGSDRTKQTPSSTPQMVSEQRQSMWKAMKKMIVERLRPAVPIIEEICCDDISSDKSTVKRKRMLKETGTSGKPMSNKLREKLKRRVSSFL